MPTTQTGCCRAGERTRGTHTNAIRNPRSPFRPKSDASKRAAERRLAIVSLHLPMLVFFLGAHAPSAQAQDRSPAPAYDWTGFYFGAHLGLAWGSSSWTARPNLNGSTNLFQGLDSFDEGGSWFAGVQGGYNYLLPNRVLLGVEADASFPSWPTLPTGVNPFGVSVGGTSTFTSPTLGPVSLAETVQESGTVRGRIGYAPGKWLFYLTGGLTWTYNQQSLTQVSTGTTSTPFLWRLGWTAGAGVEVPFAPHWTARLEYLFSDYGKKTTSFFAGAQPVSSDFKLHELRLGLNYRFGGNADGGSASTENNGLPDNISLHGQTTFVWQGYPPIRSPFEGLDCARSS